VRFTFRQIAAGAAGPARARPIIDVVVGGLDLAPQACLLDTSAMAVRLGSHVADLVGIDLTGAHRTQIAVGGELVEGRLAEVSLEIADRTTSHRWEAPVWFCTPWRPAFGLLGLTGFFDHFVVTVAAYEEWMELRPVSV
jgi:hypothetical protein